MEETGRWWKLCLNITFNDKILHGERKSSQRRAEKWKEMTPKEKKQFEDMAEKDKARSSYVPVGGQSKKRKLAKDPNAPKRALSAFFHFCAEERPCVLAANPGIGLANVAKELGKKWQLCTNKLKYEQLALEDKARYERDMVAYRGVSGASAVPKASRKKAKVDDDDIDEDEDEDEDDDE